MKTIKPYQETIDEYQKQHGLFVKKIILSDDEFFNYYEEMFNDYDKV